MIECFWAPTPNSRRVTMMLEECDLAYVRRAVDLAAGEQKRPEFLALNPAGAVPVIRITRDESPHPLVLSQSGAICLHLAQISGKLLPPNGREHAAALQWFAWALSDLGGTATALYRLSVNGDDMRSALTMMEQRMAAVLSLLDGHLEDQEWIAGAFSIADVAAYPVLLTPFVAAARAYAPELPHLSRWSETMAARPAIARGM